MSGVLDGVALLCGETGDEESSCGVPDVQACGGIRCGGADADVLGEEGYNQEAYTEEGSPGGLLITY